MRPALETGFSPPGLSPGSIFRTCIAGSCEQEQVILSEAWPFGLFLARNPGWLQSTCGCPWIVSAFGLSPKAKVVSLAETATVILKRNAALPLTCPQRGDIRFLMVCKPPLMQDCLTARILGDGANAGLSA